MYFLFTTQTNSHGLLLFHTPLHWQIYLSFIDTPALSLHTWSCPYSSRLALSYGHAMASILSKPFSLFSEPVGTTSPLRRLACCSERCRKHRLSLPLIPLFWLHLGPIGHNLFSSNVQYLCIFIRRGFIPHSEVFRYRYLSLSKGFNSSLLRDTDFLFLPLSLSSSLHSFIKLASLFCKNWYLSCK